MVSMAPPGERHATFADDDLPSGSRIWEPTPQQVETLLACLAVSRPNLSLLDDLVKTALRNGGRLFEVVSGSPSRRYGQRVTLRPNGDRSRLAAAVGLGNHPWGSPDWVGLRGSHDGDVRAKGYHRLRDLNRTSWRSGWFVPPPRSPLGERLPVPPGLPEDLVPVMVATDRDDVELYLRCTKPRAWPSFVGMATRAVSSPGSSPARDGFEPMPRPVPGSFCLSLRWDRDGIRTVTVFADRRSLPDDAAIARQWTVDLDEPDREAYERALIGVRSLGRPKPGGWHGMLAWAFERDGERHRAVSLRMPR